MKRLTMFAACLLLCVAALAIAGDETPWFDMENCEMCRIFASQPGLMEHVNWEQYKIEHGLMMISSTTPEYLDKFRAANEEADELGAKLMSGYEAKLCGSCQALGLTMAHGANLESVDTRTGNVMLLTATDDAVIGEIHKMADRNTEEMEKMMQAMPEGEGSHEGHGH